MIRQDEFGQDQHWFKYGHEFNAEEIEEVNNAFKEGAFVEFINEDEVLYQVYRKTTERDKHDMYLGKIEESILEICPTEDIIYIQDKLDEKYDYFNGRRKVYSVKDYSDKFIGIFESEELVRDKCGYDCVMEEITLNERRI